MRFLIADDHEVVRQGLRALLLDHQGWEVCAEASNGMEAVDLARRFAPDIAILDVGMPMLGGVEATRRIRAAVPATQVLLYTVHDTDQLLADAREAGARGCVLKSESASELMSAIESALRPAHCAASAGSSNAAAAGVADRGVSAGITARQCEIVRLIAEGKGSKEIADVLQVSVRTVETHRNNVMRRLRLRSTVELVRYALRNLIVDA